MRKQRKMGHITIVGPSKASVKSRLDKLLQRDTYDPKKGITFTVKRYHFQPIRAHAMEEGWALNLPGAGTGVLVHVCYALPRYCSRQAQGRLVTLDIRFSQFDLLFPLILEIGFLRVHPLLTLQFPLILVWHCHWHTCQWNTDSK